jgi:hypothetical protein
MELLHAAGAGLSRLRCAFCRAAVSLLQRLADDVSSTVAVGTLELATICSVQATTSLQVLAEEARGCIDHASSRNNTMMVTVLLG